MKRITTVGFVILLLSSDFMFASSDSDRWWRKRVNFHTAVTKQFISDVEIFEISAIEKIAEKIGRSGPQRPEITFRVSGIFNAGPSDCQGKPVFRMIGDNEESTASLILVREDADGWLQANRACNMLRAPTYFSSIVNIRNTYNQDSFEHTLTIDQFIGASAEITVFYSNGNGWSFESSNIGLP